MKERRGVKDVQNLLRDRLPPLHTESIPLRDAFRRVPREIPLSPVNLPPYPKAAMDGFALRSADTETPPTTLRIVGKSAIGLAPPTEALLTGEAMRIATGAAVPEGADVVVPIEDVQVEKDRLQIRNRLSTGKHVIRVGEDLESGAKVLPAPSLHRPLRPQDLGLLSAVGVTEISVIRRPRVRVIATGNELLAAGSRPHGHWIVDSNSPMLAALVQRDGGNWQGVTYRRDSLDDLRNDLQNADADVILITGGTSVGEEDFAARAVDEMGELAVHGIHIRPGAPAGIGFLPGNRIVFLLPGNPVACLCIYDLFAGPLIRSLGGRSADLPYSRVRAPMLKAIRSEAGRVDYVRVKMTGKHLEPIPGGASRLSTAVHADGFVLVPEEVTEIAANQDVDAYMY